MRRMSEVIMPRLSDSMEEGTIVRWLKASGDAVARGEPLVEIETDKATMSYEAEASGVLEILAREGETLSIGEVIALIGERALSTSGASTNDASSAVRTPAPNPARAVNSTVTAPLARDGSRLNVSPVALRLAREQGVDLTALRGSGPGGRIVRADVQAAAAEAARALDGGGQPRAPDRVATPAPGAPAPLPWPAAGPAALVASEEGGCKGEVTLRDASRSQHVVARRMTESKATIPDFTLSAEIDMEACVSLRAESKVRESVPPTYNDMVVKACALALREFPRANGSYRDGRFELHSRINVGVAVAGQDLLVVPTVFDADSKSLLTIARETQALSDRVRDGTITPPELFGGTFTVSNLGMYGVRSFTAIINPPQAAILSVGTIEPRAVVRDGEIVASHTMSVTLACDHRIIYGVEAAKFLAHVRAMLERPIMLAP